MAGTILDFLSDNAISFVALVIIVAVGSIILLDLESSGSFANTASGNIITTGNSALTTFASFFVVIVVIVVAVAILFLVRKLQNTQSNGVE